MYAASNDFHNAVANGNEEKLLLIFPDAVFTEEDIDITDGLEFRDFFNLADNLSIGQTPSNEISFTLVNRNRLLNNYEFGEFTATLGVYIGSQSYNHGGIVTVLSNATWVGNARTPYLTRNGATVSNPPAWPVASMMCYDGKMWVFSEDGQYAVYNEATGANITASSTVNAFMRNKAKGWAGRGFYYDKTNRILHEFENGTRKRYEFVPLGVFTADRPNVPDKITIQLVCYDRMQKLDKDMPDAATLGIGYPVTIGNLFAAICNYAGIPYRTNAFINSTATVDAEPDAFENATMRTVMGWIAEAAGSNAKVNRDGYMVMDWIRSTNASYDEHGWSEFDPYWYETKKVSKLYNRNTSETSETSYGNGTENYLIQDNPLFS